MYLPSFELVEHLDDLLLALPHVAVSDGVHRDHVGIAKHGEEGALEVVDIVHGEDHPPQAKVDRLRRWSDLPHVLLHLLRQHELDSRQVAAGHDEVVPVHTD